MEIPSGLINLAEDTLGAKALWATDDFFAAKERMLQRSEPVFRAGRLRRAWSVDGWLGITPAAWRRSRRLRRAAWPIRASSASSISIRGISPATFRRTLRSRRRNDADPLSPTARWTPILAKSALQGNSHNPFPIDNASSWRFLRLNIFPDGGIARLRVWGAIEPDWNAIGSDRLIDLFAMENGGTALEANDQHYGNIGNLNRPGRGVNMGDGWETRRRREPGYDWAIVRLGHPGTIQEVEIDTAHFRGNFPDRVSLQATLIKSPSDASLAAASADWPILLPEQPMRADAQHRYKTELTRLGPVSHVRMNLHPDGGVSRLRLLGTIARP